MESTDEGVFRILALDGGGIKGTYTASVLAALERATNKKVSDHFDLILGTSTGGIIALGLGLGIPAAEILEFYSDRGPRIFHASLLARIRKWFFAKFDNTPLRDSLNDVFGKKLLGHSKTRLVIPAFDADRGNIQLFKTAHDARYANDHMELATAIALSTSAAPTFFDAHTTETGSCYLDGGVWANCPALLGILEAMCVLAIPTNQIRVLSIGTTTAPYSVSKARRKGGKLMWANDVVTLFTQAQVQGTIGKCRLILGDRFLRVDETVTPGRFELDKASEIAALRSLGESSARIHGDAIRKSFLFKEADAFKPHHETPGL